MNMNAKKDPCFPKADTLQRPVLLIQHLELPQH